MNIQMNYEETLNWMFAQLPMYQRVGTSAYKVDLSNTIKLAQHLGNPQTTFKSVHVAGTNGKGSTSHMIASVLQEAGYKVGLYTSPHLKDYRERIKINGEMISERFVVDFIEKNKSYFESNSLSFFEMTVGLAFQYFSDRKVDIAIIETGLGGRLDSTNIVIPEVSVITNIGLDHTQFLGTTFQAIAKEKAGIIKPYIPVVIGRSHTETIEVFKTVAQYNGSTLHLAENIVSDIPTDLKGSYQRENVRTAIQTLYVLKDLGWKINSKLIYAGLTNVIKNTGLLGRWQTLQLEPKVLVDTAHNFDGLQIVLEQLSCEPYDNLHIVLGMVKDKNLEELLPLFPVEATYYFVKPNIPRGMDENKLQELAKKFELIGSAFGSINLGYSTALQAATKSDCVFVGGSTFTVAEII
ncbi:bifunctional folylpolyglutamate synthase/dihydrofolate synthase [Aquimarina sp. W85]|uniref:bifunctional folylpolyglutamate synthase/dihydrofolate synthase n=1 Tax=Aquimarina rhodophyticola TaxID=3342246 RepID=UPI0036728D23